MIDLKFDHVSKRYLVGQDRDGDKNGNRLVRKVKSLRRRTQEFWAVRDVSFEVPRGQALGIIGHNGAGKSTILKMLAGITAPTSGEIQINGRLAALIEVGSGLHPEFTGRENVFLSGSIRGMSRREITEKFDSIVDFAGIRQFMDTPIKRYSSGMHVRLGFAIAAHLESDILLLDEVLAVGDASFRTKCYKRVDGLKQAGKTIVFISHDLKSVERLCERVILMQRGELIADGNPHEVVKEYMSVAAKAAPINSHHSSALPPVAEINSVTFSDAENRESAALRTGKPAIFRVHYKSHARLADVSFNISFASPESQSLCHLATSNNGRQLDLEPGEGTVEFYCPSIVLMPGVYYITVSIKSRQGLPSTMIDFRPNYVMVRVDPGEGKFYGRFHMSHDSQLLKKDPDGDEHVAVNEGELASQL